jgi:hypothetical protein
MQQAPSMVSVSGGFVVANFEFLGEVAENGGRVYVLYHRGRYEGHTKAARGSPEGELLVFYRGGAQPFVEAAELYQRGLSVSGRVRVDEVNGTPSSCSPVAVLELHLNEARHQGSLTA